MAASQKECRELICWAALLGQPLVLCSLPSLALIRGRNKLTHKRSKFPRKLDKKGQIFSVTFCQCQFSRIICSLAVFSSIGCWRLSKKICTLSVKRGGGCPHLFCPNVKNAFFENGLLRIQLSRQYFLNTMTK